MIKLILSLATILITLVSCGLQDNQNEMPSANIHSISQEIKNIPEGKVTIIVYEGCVYII